MGARTRIESRALCANVVRCLPLCVFLSVARAGLKGKASSVDGLKYTGDKKSDAFLRFVQAEAGVWVGLPGQVKEFDEMAKGFDKDPKGTLAKAEKAVSAASESNADSAKYYLKVCVPASRRASRARGYEAARAGLLGASRRLTEARRISTRRS